eukprot:13164-Pelagococcus_subviridis.AAC.1
MEHQARAMKDCITEMFLVASKGAKSSAISAPTVKASWITETLRPHTAFSKVRRMCTRSHRRI